mgnify:CR=1 FL=1
MRDLTSKGLIVTKGVLFFGLAVVSACLLLVEAPSFRVAVLLAILVWSSCRFYYFLFYVLEQYVDPSLRYAGLLSLLGQLRRARNSKRDE